MSRAGGEARIPVVEERVEVGTKQTSVRANPSYANRDWGSVEADFRADWEKKNPGTWDRFKSAVRHAWEDVKR